MVPEKYREDVVNQEVVLKLWMEGLAKEKHINKREEKRCRRSRERE